jgi:hypothetical protein
MNDDTPLIDLGDAQLETQSGGPGGRLDGNPTVGQSRTMV